MLSGTLRRLGLNLFIIAIVLSSAMSCALFDSHHDANAYQYFTKLKAYHLKFLEDYSDGNASPFEIASARSACDNGELKFREASEYSQGKKTQSRVRAIEYLHNAFKHDCKLLADSKKYLGSVYAQEQIKELSENYNFAIDGEISRVGAPAK